MKYVDVDYSIRSVVVTGFFVFFIVYNINFVFSPLFTSARISILLLVLYFHKNGFSFKIEKYTFLNIIFLLASLTQNYFSGDFTQSSRFFHLILYSFLGASLIANLARDLKIALLAYISAITVQAVIIIICMFDSSLKESISLFVVFSANYEFDNAYRSTGFTSSGGADLSFIQSIGVVSGVWLLSIIENKKNSLQIMYVIFSIVLCFISTIFVGRTGLIVSVVFIFWYILAFSRHLNTRYIIHYLIILLIIYTLINFLLKEIDNIENFSTDYFYEWAFGFFLIGNDPSLDVLRDMPIPPLSIETILGTGLVVDPLGNGNASSNDSGYIQNYFSMGLILSVIFYLSLIYNLIYFAKKSGIIALLFFVTLLVFESKEPFIFKYNYVMFLMATYYVSMIQVETDINGNNPKHIII